MLLPLGYSERIAISDIPSVVGSVTRFCGFLPSNTSRFQCRVTYSRSTHDYSKTMHAPLHNQFHVKKCGHLSPDRKGQAQKRDSWSRIRYGIISNCSLKSAIYLYHIPILKRQLIWTYRPSLSEQSHGSTDDTSIGWTSPANGFRPLTLWTKEKALYGRTNPRGLST